MLLIGLGTAALAIILFQGSRIARTLIALFMILRIAAHIWVWISVGSDAAVVAMIEILIAPVVLILLFSREITAFLTGMKSRSSSALTRKAAPDQGPGPLCVELMVRLRRRC